MARRSSGGTATVEPTETPEATVSETDTTSEEASVTITEPSPTESEAPVTEAPAKAELTEEQINEALAPFISAMEATVAQRDESTGIPSDEALAETTKAYHALEGGQRVRNAAKKAVTKAMTDAMNSADVLLARAYMEVQERSLVPAAKAGKVLKERKPKEPVNPTEAFVERVASLSLAVELVGNEAPEGVDEDWGDKAEALVQTALSQADAYRTWLLDESEDKGDAPDVSPVTVAGVKLALGKAAKPGKKIKTTGGVSTYSGPRRDVAKHIQEAFASKNSGDFLLIAEIANFKSTEYGDDSPSSGAISARLFPKGGGKCTVEGVIPDTNEQAHKGARKA